MFLSSLEQGGDVEEGEADGERGLMLVLSHSVQRCILPSHKRGQKSAVVVLKEVITAALEEEQRTAFNCLQSDLLPHP